MARLLAVLFVTIIPTVLGLSLVKLNERQKVGLPMFAYSKLNISDLNSMAEKFKQFFADVKESLDEYVESLTASGDGELEHEEVDEKNKQEIIQSQSQTEDWKDQLKGLESKKQEVKKTEIEGAKGKIENSDAEIKVLTKINEVKTQDVKPKDIKIVDLEKLDKGKGSDEKPVYVETPKKVIQENTADKQIDNKEAILKDTKVIVEEKEPIKVNKVEDLEKINVKQETVPEKKKDNKEVTKSEPSAKPVADTKPIKVPSPPEKIQLEKKVAIKVDSGITEEL